VSGSAVYPSDVSLPKMLYGAILRCPHPHARAKKIETGKAKGMAGVALAIVFTGDQAAVKNAEPMEQNEYKIPLFRGLIEQQLMAIVQPGSR
jgi:CO/xanthine dehydrogenase Mo-binding subunit